jgi:hypothetical protein
MHGCVRPSLRYLAEGVCYAAMTLTRSWNLTQQHTSTWCLLPLLHITALLLNAHLILSCVTVQIIPYRNSEAIVCHGTAGYVKLTCDDTSENSTLARPFLPYAAAPTSPNEAAAALLLSSSSSMLNTLAAAITTSATDENTLPPTDVRYV